MEHVSDARALYVRRRWQHAVMASGSDRHIALYGGGRHTRWLLERVLSERERAAIAVILDDSAREEAAPIAGVPVKRPDAVDARRFGVVVASSDGFEPQLLLRAAAWSSRAGGAEVPRVVGLYEGLPAGPYDGGHEPMFAELVEDPRDPAVVVEERFGPLTIIRRLPAAPSLETETLPIPPRGRRSGYDGDDAWYLSSGEADARAVISCVCEHAGPTWSPEEVLEWGCSSGRVLRHMPTLLPERSYANFWGCDIDATSTQWAATHLSPPLKIFRSGLMPPLPFESGSMDLIYAISVFTHIAEHWDTWLMELRRVVRPGGYVFVSINDERVWDLCGRQPNCYVARLSPRLDFASPMRDDFIAQGSGPHAQSFWSTQGVRRRWAFAFDVRGFTPGAIGSLQTGVVLQRPVEIPY
ncbi:MAG: methyltransferase domain-containing protein [Phycisphaerales bacterium]